MNNKKIENYREVFCREFNPYTSNVNIVLKKDLKIKTAKDQLAKVATKLSRSPTRICCGNIVFGNI